MANEELRPLRSTRVTASANKSSVRSTRATRRVVVALLLCAQVTGSRIHKAAKGERECQTTADGTIAAPEKSIRFLDPVLSNNTNRLTFTCLAEDLYPRPQIKMKMHRNSKAVAVAYEEYYENKLDGRYDARAVASIEPDKIELPTIFQCEVSIPEANYTSVQEYVYNGSHVPCLSLLLITLNLVTLRRY